MADITPKKADESLADDEQNCKMEKLKSFDFGEIGGGKQLIIDYRPISATEYYVATVGNAPKIKDKTGNANDTKLRFFKLTWQENDKYFIEEYVTLETISKVAKFFV